MKLFIKFYVLLKLLVEVSFIVGYTVVLKPVKPLYPPVKVYRYELRHPKVITENQYFYHKPVPGQRLYPVVVKQQRDPNSRTWVPPKKEKRKFVLKPVPKEKPLLRDQRLYGLPQQLVPPVTNQIEEYSESKEEEPREQENDIRHLLSLPQDDKSFSSFGQEKGRIYSKPGNWATPAPVLDSDNTTKPVFTPSQLYLQIRHKNTVIHVPQTEALKDAETLEELINAPRLKELARTTHVQEVYSEEGYEDAGYDHAGHIRHAQHGEVYDAKDEGKFRIKQPPIILDYDSDLEESKPIPLKNISSSKTNSANENSNEKPEPRITRSRTETSKKSVEYAKTPQGYKGDHKYSSRVKAPLNLDNGNSNNFNTTQLNQEVPEPTFPSYFGELPPAPENILANNTFVSLLPVPKKSSKYRKEELNSTKIYPVSETSVPAQEYTDFKPYLSMIDSQASPSAKSLKYSRIYSKKTKQLRLEPYKTGNVYKPLPAEDLQPPVETVKEESVNDRIVLPTIGYINSLTTAHFGKGSSPKSEEPRSQLTTALNLTEALTYLRSSKNHKSHETTEVPSETDIRTFEPMKLKKTRPRHYNKTKRDVYLVSEKEERSETSQSDNEGNDENDEPHDEKNEEIAEDERIRTEEENLEKEKYEKELREEITKKEKEIIRETFKNIGVQKDISEVFPILSSSDFEADAESTSSKTTEAPVDLVKYPFYFSKRLPENSPLRYATDPKKFPRKSGYKMEFYDSRDDYIQCPDFHPDLDDLPSSNSTEYSEEQAGDNQRLAGLGDKIACLRMKYFDREPFDNPIFKEKEIDYVGKHKKGLKSILKTRSSQTRLQPKRVESILKAAASQPIKNNKLPSNFVKIKLKNSSPQGIQLTKYLRPSNSTILKAQSVIAPKLKQPTNIEANQNRIIPVTEIPDGSVPTFTENVHKTTQTPKSFIKQSKGNPFYLKPTAAPSEIVISKDCLPSISQLGALDGSKNVIIYCNDAILIQEILNDVAYLRIIPKVSQQNHKSFKKIWSPKPEDKYSYQTEWVPIVGYNLPNAPRTTVARRKTDEVKITKNETSSNTSPDHYIIDELKEDENVRKGEVVEDMDHYLKLMENITKTTPRPETTTEAINSAKKNETRVKREAQSDPNKLKKKAILTKRPNIIEKIDFDLIEKVTQKEIPIRNAIVTQDSEDNNGTIPNRPFEQKRTLTRLSGKDFLTRYHKNKAKPIPKGQTADFWKITTPIPLLNEKTSKKFFPQTTTTATTSIPQIKPDSREVTQPPKTTSSTTERYYIKPETKQTNEFRKISPSNQIDEKVTKKSESRPLANGRARTETTTEAVNPENKILSKIITKVSKVISESSEKPQTLFVKEEKLINVPETGNVVQKPPQYKTIDRSSNKSKKNDTEESSRYIASTDGPTLYYVVDSLTGRGKWITNYEERKRSSERFRKARKLNRRPKPDKRRKKQKK